MKENKNMQNVGSAFVWKMGERFLTQIVNLAIQIVLARIIAPEAFGSLAILVVFVNLATIITQKGLSSSLIRKKVVTEQDYNCAFAVSLMLAIVLYIILFFGAPVISQIYQDENLIYSLRIIAIMLVFGALYCVENVAMIRGMRFKDIFFVGFLSTTISGGISIGLAYVGWGIYALVVQNVLHMLLLAILSYKYLGYCIKPVFSRNSWSEIISFGGNVLVCEMIVYFVESIRSLLIGRQYSTEDLSYYNRGQTYPSYLMNAIYSSIGSVMLPAFSKISEEKYRLLEAFFMVKKTLMMFIIPIFSALAVLSEEIIVFLLTEKWISAAPYMAIFSLVQLFVPIQGLCRQVIYSLDNSKAVLKIETLGAGIALGLFAISCRFSIPVIAGAVMVSNGILAGLYSAEVGKLLQISWWRVFFSGSKYIIYSGVMLIIPLFIRECTLNIFLKLFLSGVIGVTVYIICLVVTKDKIFANVVNYMKRSN